MLDRLDFSIARESQMDATYCDRLRHRQEEVATTLRHLDTERREVEENTEWVDRAAYETRVDLLDHLTTWYQEEISQIEKALERLDFRLYSLCLGCHEPIGTERNAHSGAEFCFECQESRDQLGSL